MGETISCNSWAVAAPGAEPGAESVAAGGTWAVGTTVAAGVGVAGSGVTDGEGDAGGSSLREQPVNTGEVDIRTAAASIKGSDLPWGLTSNFIFDNPRARTEAEVVSRESKSGKVGSAITFRGDCGSFRLSDPAIFQNRSRGFYPGLRLWCYPKNTTGSTSTGLLMWVCTESYQQEAGHIIIN
jgi:hypothetical protein